MENNLENELPKNNSKERKQKFSEEYKGMSLDEIYHEEQEKHETAYNNYLKMKGDYTK